MKDLYTIGETAKLLGVTTQTLRFYDKCGLLHPKYVDAETGYRYYSFHQFHYIDRIKYLQSFGMPLEDIKKIILSGSADKLVAFLRKQRELKLAELEKLKVTVQTIDWYIDYFTFLNRENHAESLYRVHLPTRYALAVPCYEDDIPISKMEVRLAEAKARPEFRNLNFLRQYAYIADYEKLLNKQFRAYSYFIYLSEKPEGLEPPDLLVLPEGEYLCYRARILTDYWDTSPLRDYFESNPAPRLLIANEFEENLIEYLETQYELQILL